MLDHALLLIFPAVMAFGGAMDLFTMTIPNRVSLALVVAFFVAAPFAGLGWAGLAMHLAAGLVVLGVGFVMFARGWLGGGDAKLLAAAALWMGFENLLAYVVLVAVAGGLLALGVLAYRCITPPSWLSKHDWAMRLHAKGSGMPYGVALAGAGLWIYPATFWFSTLAS
jgi:prepilin peptidase CpaA